MIARIVLATGLPPEVFGVDCSPELGAVIVEEFADQSQRRRAEERLSELRSR